MVEQPEPDTKDWTWVLERACPECGFDSGAPARDELAGLAVVIGGQWQRTLATHPEPRTRPAPRVWSPLEYGCHVRDVFDLATMRTGLMREEDGVRFANWDQDATAVEDAYADQDPAVVAQEIGAAARAYGDVVASVRADEWTRRGLRSDGATFTVESFTRYLLHDPAHHLADVTGQPFRPS